MMTDVPPWMSGVEHEGRLRTAGAVYLPHEPNISRDVLSLFY